jgi:nicotinamidase-related amidase
MLRGNDIRREQTVSGNLVTMQAEPWEFPFDPATTALLVIDMQNDFTLPGGYCHQYMEARGLGGDDAISTLRTPIDPIQRCLDAARAAGMTVIYTVESHWADLSDAAPPKMDGTIRVGAPIGATGPHGRNLVRGDWGTEVIEELTPLPEEHVLHKAGKGGFVATDLDLILRSRGITHLVFTGITTDCCVLFTRQGARDRGYHTIQLEDACAASVKENHDAIFNMIRTHPEAFGIMGTSEAFVDAVAPVAAATA